MTISDEAQAIWPTLATVSVVEATTETSVAMAELAWDPPVIATVPTLVIWPICSIATPS